jgi:hypothetical protein
MVRREELELSPVESKESADEQVGNSTSGHASSSYRQATSEQLRAIVFRRPILER